MYFYIGRSVALQRRQKMAQPSKAPIFVFQITLCFSQTRSEGRFTGFLICSIIEPQFRNILINFSLINFQLYPETPDQMELIMYQATKAGFSGGVVVDYPNSTKAKKYYLCLFAGVQATNDQMPTGNHFSANIRRKYLK